MSALVEANQAMKEATDADQASKTDKAEADSKENTAEQSSKTGKGKVQKEEGTNEAGNVNMETAAQSTEMAEAAAAAPELTLPVNYVSVDVRL